VDLTAPAIFEIGLVLLLAVAAGWLARRLGLSAVIGYIVVGLAVSPFTPGYAADRSRLQLLADIGVVLLLFEVGIEIDPLRLGRERRRLLIVAPIQALLTALIAFGVFLAFGVPRPGAALIGLSVALSSSVVVVNMTRSRRRTTDRRTEEDLLGWSVLQDLTGVAMATALLSVIGLGSRGTIARTVGLVAFLALAAASAWALPKILSRLAGQHDLFLILSLASGLALAGLGSEIAGIPLALAAFIAGLAISESKPAAEARRRILPFREVFAVLFFVSIGALIDPRQLPDALPWIALLLGLAIAGKVLIVAVLSRVAHLHARHWQLAVGLGQIGEFSFVLASLASAAGLISAALYAAVLASVALTIAASTVLVRVGFRRPPTDPDAVIAKPAPRRIA
jgi:monovalent cation:H+ antiporter-2, CPA2 family